ncbi:uncharacterized protein J4E79_008588 [Alternaria viburni]|uniref:uncharacterized protein n=1 Tax=Alternaria viburni TaxID=566460 RepID=UPI0020C3B325|nr:uncharacterized protein J4E79_008588 [Alternaria viburni]KAI4653075.1 hypothetical protein J4E79_008588 [Alternaria viburni]
MKTPPPTHKPPKGRDQPARMTKSSRVTKSAGEKSTRATQRGPAPPPITQAPPKEATNSGDDDDLDDSDQIFIEALLANVPDKLQGDDISGEALAANHLERAKAMSDGILECFAHCIRPAVDDRVKVLMDLWGDDHDRVQHDMVREAQSIARVINNWMERKWQVHI